MLSRYACVRMGPAFGAFAGAKKSLDAAAKQTETAFSAADNPNPIVLRVRSTFALA